MNYREFEEILENADPDAALFFEDGAYVVGGHTEMGEMVRIFRNDDLGYDVGAQLVPREFAEEHASEPAYAGNLRRHLSAQCGWRWAGADVVASLPGEPFFRHVAYAGEDGDGNVLLVAGDRRESCLF